MRRTVLAPILALLLVVTGLLVMASQGPATAQISPLEAEPVHAPTLPPPPVAYVNMTCTSGQVDLNTASVDTLMSALGLPAEERNVAERVVARRPYNGLPDLLAVPGMGPGTVNALEPSAFCVTPLGGLNAMLNTIPADTCPVGSDLVDINTASPAAINKVLPGTPQATRPTAQRVAARAQYLPFPDLDHLIAVPGIGPGDLAKIRDRLCLTPAPVLTTDSSGNPVAAALITQDQDIRLVLSQERGEFALGVPAGTLNADHSWATVTQVDPQRDLGVPVADLHIHGVWSGVVWATAPTETLGLDGWIPALVHMPSDGSAPQWSAAAAADVSNDGNSVTAPLTSLSKVQGLSVPPTYFTGVPLQPQTASSILDSAWGTISQILDYRTSPPTCPVTDVDYDYTAEITGVKTDNGETLHCSWVDNTTGRLHAKFTQNRNYVMKAKIIAVDGSGATFIPGFGGAPSTPVGWAIQSLLQLGTHPDYAVAAPGGTFEIQLSPLATTARMDFKVLGDATAAYVLANIVLDAVLPDSAAVSRVTQAAECMYPIIANDMYQDGLSALDAAGNLYDCIAETFPDLVEIFATKGGKALVKRALFIADGGVTIYDVTDARIQDIVAWIKNEPEAQVRYVVNDNPGPYPLTDQYGRAVVSQCVSGGSFDPKHGFTPFVLDQACQDAHYGGIPDTGGNDPQDNDQGGTRYMATGRTDGTIPTSPDTMGKVLVFGRGDIPDGYVYSDGDFGTITNPAYIRCMALTQSIPVRYDTPQSVFNAWVQALGPWGSYGGGTCNTPAYTWIADGLRNFILRDVDNGASFLLSESGTTIHPIQDGGTFNCLAQRYLVRETNDPTGRVNGGFFQPYAVGSNAVCS